MGQLLRTRKRIERASMNYFEIAKDITRNHLKNINIIEREMYYLGRIKIDMVYPDGVSKQEICFDYFIGSDELLYSQVGSFSGQDVGVPYLEDRVPAELGDIYKMICKKDGLKQRVKIEGAK